MSRLVKGDDLPSFNLSRQFPHLRQFPFAARFNTPDSSDRHHACHLRLTSQASAWAMVLLSLGLIVYAPHCPS